MSGLTVDNEEVDPLHNAVKAMTDGDSITAVAWALIDVALSLRDAQAFREECAEKTDNEKSDLFSKIMDMFGAKKVVVPNVLCTCTCGHDIVDHEDGRCGGSVSDTIEGVPIQGACACVEFKLKP
jgi:hypothetical protein